MLMRKLLPRTWVKFVVAAVFPVDLGATALRSAAIAAHDLLPWLLPRRSIARVEIEDGTDAVLAASPSRFDKFDQDSFGIDHQSPLLVLDTSHIQNADGLDTPHIMPMAKGRFYFAP
jgi:hypothetical protein